MCCRRELRGAGFGLRQALDSVGAVAGPAAAAFLLLIYRDDIRSALWWAVLPAILAVLTIVLLVREPERRQPANGKPRPSLARIAAMPAAFWIATAAAALLTLARFSEAFLILRAARLGVPEAMVPLALALMSVAYALSAYPAGVLSDRIGRYGLLASGVAVLVAADLTLAFAQGTALLALGIVLWGLHMGLTQGLLSAMVADAAPSTLRGTAFGIFYAVSGAALLIASSAAGVLWDVFGAPAPFLAGAGVGLGALVMLWFVPRPAH